MSGIPDVGERSDPACTIYVVGEDSDRAAVQASLSGWSQSVVRGFRSGAAFLDEAGELAPGVVLVDGDLSGTDPIDLLHAIGRDHDHLVAVMLSGKASVALAVAAMKAKAADFLERPCAPTDLIAAVEAAALRVNAQRAAAGQAARARAGLARLSSRECEVLKGLIDGRPNKEIAQALNLSHRTVEIYRANLMEKLGVRSLSEALRIAFAAGLFPDG